jgi:hypothetical protein
VVITGYSRLQQVTAGYGSYRHVHFVLLYGVGHRIASINEEKCLSSAEPQTIEYAS